MAAGLSARVAGLPGYLFVDYVRSAGARRGPPLFYVPYSKKIAWSVKTPVYTAVSSMTAVGTYIRGEIGLSPPRGSTQYTRKPTLKSLPFLSETAVVPRSNECAPRTKEA